METILQEQVEKLTNYEKMQKAVRHEYNSINNQIIVVQLSRHKFNLFIMNRYM